MAFFRVWTGASRMRKCGVCVLQTTQPCMVFLLSSRDRKDYSLFSVASGMSRVASPKNFSLVWPLRLCWKHQPASVNHGYQRRTCQAQLALQCLMLFWRYLFFPNDPGHPTQTLWWDSLTQASALWGAVLVPHLSVIICPPSVTSKITISV